MKCLLYLTIGSRHYGKVGMGVALKWRKAAAFREMILWNIAEAVDGIPNLWFGQGNQMRWSARR